MFHGGGAAATYRLGPYQALDASSMLLGLARVAVALLL